MTPSFNPIGRACAELDSQSDIYIYTVMTKIIAVVIVLLIVNSNGITNTKNNVDAKCHQK